MTEKGPKTLIKSIGLLTQINGEIAISHRAILGTFVSMGLTIHSICLKAYVLLRVVKGPLPIVLFE